MVISKTTFQLALLKVALKLTLKLALTAPLKVAVK